MTNKEATSWSSLPDFFFLFYSFFISIIHLGYWCVWSPPSLSVLSICFSLLGDQCRPLISRHRWATELRITFHNVRVCTCSYRPYFPNRVQPSCLSTSVCQTQAALTEVTGGAVPVILVQRCVNICHEAHVQLGGSRHMDVTAAMKPETWAGLFLLYWASCLSSSALIRDDGPRPPPPPVVYR